MADSYVQWYKDDAGEYRFRKRAGNHEIVASSEGYTTKASVLEAARREYPDLEIKEVDD